MSPVNKKRSLVTRTTGKKRRNVKEGKDNERICHAAKEEKAGRKGGRRNNKVKRALVCLNT